MMTPSTSDISVGIARGRVVKLPFLSCVLKGCAYKSTAAHYDMHTYVPNQTAPLGAV